MASKKKSAKKVSTRKPRAAQAYELTSKGQTALSNDEYGPQAKLVAQALNRKGSATAAQVASAIDGRLTTKQPVVRVAAFYLGEFKRDGLAKATKAVSKKGPSLVA